jgi:hypothetical protein
MLMVQSDNVIAAILQAVAYFDAVVLGATREPLFEGYCSGRSPS